MRGKGGRYGRRDKSPGIAAAFETEQEKAACECWKASFLLKYYNIYINR
jgi:hypothetical protein